MRYVRLSNGRSPRSVLDKKLWSNQRDALSIAAQYLDSPSLDQAIIRMPTGTGKTAIIAVLAQLAADYPNVLIVAPWEHLAAQLHREVSSRFWQKSSLERKLTLRSVRQFTPSSLKSLLEFNDEGRVLICTNQTLERLYSTKPTVFTDLRNWVQLALVDEGHREPAPKWAEAIRNLVVKTILFTATPYRNDRRLFNLDRKFRYTFTFPEAVASGIIRDVHFIASSWSRTNNVYADFVTKLLKCRTAIAKRIGCATANVRVIVRCHSCDAVRAVTNALVDAKQKAIGVHHRFTSADGSHLVKTVPDPVRQDASFWVHQEKLVEGLDDPRFRLVALFNPFTNTRSLVQQVGRVIRNPGHRRGEIAFVFSHEHDQEAEAWERFLRYERDLQVQGGTEISASDAFARARQNMPAFYFLGDFREQLVSADIQDPASVVRLRKSVRILRKRPNFEFDAAVIGVRDDVIKRDGEFFGEEHRTPNTFLQLYEVFQQSPLLKIFYLEARIAYVVLREVGDLVFFYDSEGAMPDLLSAVCDLLSPRELQRLFPNTSSTIREISLLNGDLGNFSYRRRLLGTHSLKLIPPALSDYIHVCSTAAGRVAFGDAAVRRYVGFTRARISDKEARLFEFSEFIEWLDEVAAAVGNANEPGDETLDRFAVASKHDPESPISHVLFDIDVAAVTPPAGIPPNPNADDEDLWEVENGEFSGVIEGAAFDAQITYDAERRRFSIDSADLKLFQIENEDTGVAEPLDVYLNTQQAIRAVQADGVIYAQGRFFAPNVKLWGKGRKRVELLNVIKSVDGLAHTTSEKGEDAHAGDGWPGDSVFGVITDLQGGIFHSAGWNPDILICNDIASEIADFFAITQNPKRLIMIHAKRAKQNLSLSASALHEICSQAVRYLGFFNPNDVGSKLSAPLIDGKWKFGNRECDRLVQNVPGMTAIQIRDLIDRLLRDALCQREVWLVLGGGLSRGALQDVIDTGNRPRPNVIQLLYLLQSTWTTTASIGAALQVFCKP